MPVDQLSDSIVVRGTEILPTDSPELRRQKLARITLDSLVQFTWLLDPLGHVIDANKVALDAAGLALSDVQGQPFWRTIWWQVSPEISQALQDSIAQGAAGELVRWETEVFGRAEEKEVVPIEASLTPILDDRGKVVLLCAEGRRNARRNSRERQAASLIVGASHILTSDHERSATHALRQSEERFQALTTAGFDVIYRMGPDWKEMRLLVGKEFISDTNEPNRTWLEKYIDPADQQLVLDTINEAIRTKSIFELEHRVRRVDGSLGWTYSRAIPILDGNGEVTEWFGAARDVTGRRQIDTALAQQRRLYEAILTNTPDFAYVFDPHHRFIYINEGLLKMWGKSWEEAIGKTCLELGYEPWHAAMHDREIDQVIATRQPIRGEVPFTGTFGRRIYDYIFVPVFGPDGDVEAVAGTTRDVTERKEADRRKDEFLATLAHELRNPLAPIRSSIHILTMTAHGDPNTERVCAMMERQVDLMVRLVDDLMEVSRITRGKIELRKVQTTLATIVRSAVDTSQPIIAAHEHQLEILLPPETIPIVGDAARLSQVISNLLHNAAKYTDRGGTIWITAARIDQGVVIKVRDNGIGIPKESLPLVFDMFMQVERSSSRGQGGLGIGLTLVKQLVEMHGGSVSVQSDGPGQGSEFTVTLPATQPPLSVNSQSAPKMPPGSLKQRILVVDDNQDAATSLAMLIKILGAEVHIANDGPAALTLMQQHQPKIVFLDLGMPVMDGLEVARRARLLPNGGDLILIALTGWGQEEDRKRTHEAGFNHHLVKPVSVTELQTLLATITGQSG